MSLRHFSLIQQFPFWHPNAIYLDWSVQHNITVYSSWMVHWVLRTGRWTWSSGNQKSAGLQGFSQLVHSVMTNKRQNDGPDKALSSSWAEDQVRGGVECGEYLENPPPPSTMEKWSSSTLEGCVRSHSLSWLVFLEACHQINMSWIYTTRPVTMIYRGNGSYSASPRPASGPR